MGAFPRLRKPQLNLANGQQWFDGLTTNGPGLAIKGHQAQYARAARYLGCMDSGFRRKDANTLTVFPAEAGIQYALVNDSCVRQLIWILAFARMT